MSNTYRQRRSVTFWRTERAKDLAKGITPEIRATTAMDAAVAALTATTPPVRPGDMKRSAFLTAVRELRRVSGPRELFGLRIESALLEQFRAQVKKDGITMTDWLHGAIYLYLAERKK